MGFSKAKPYAAGYRDVKRYFHNKKMSLYKSNFILSILLCYIKGNGVISGRLRAGAGLLVVQPIFKMIKAFISFVIKSN